MFIFFFYFTLELYFFFVGAQLCMDAFTNSTTQATLDDFMDQLKLLITNHFRVSNFIMLSLRLKMFEYTLSCVCIVMGLI